MSLTKLVDPPSGKSVNDTTKPLVFRQPVATDAFGNLKVEFKDVDGGRRYRRRRLLAFYAIFVLIPLVLIGGLLSMMFMFGLGPFASLFHHQEHRDPQCHIRLGGGDLFEKIFSSPSTVRHESMPNPSDILNVSLTAFPPYPTVHIMHLFSDRLTVIRTQDRCYIRPMRQEMISARQRGYLEQLHGRTKMQDSLEGRINSEPWIATAVDQDPYVIHNSLIMSWCQGVPAFRLVSRQPAIPLNHWSPPPPSEVLQMLIRDGQPDSAGADHDDDDDDDADFIREMQPVPGNRRARSINLAEAMHVKSEQLPTVSDHKQQRQEAVPTSCTFMDQILEDVVMVSASEEGTAKLPRRVKVTLDLIIQCQGSQ